MTNAAFASRCGCWRTRATKSFSAESGEECSETLRRAPFDVVLLDIWLPGIDGLEALERIGDGRPPEVVMISGHGTIETAVRATKLGAYDFLEKPLSIERHDRRRRTPSIPRACEARTCDLKKQFQSKSVIVGDSIPDEGAAAADRPHGADQRPRADLWRVGHRQGTGRARVHAQSLRKDATFVEVNCAAIPEDLIESELFGTAKDHSRETANEKEGKFQRGKWRNAFLDEVGDMSLKTQSKVLRTLDETTIYSGGKRRDDDSRCARDRRHQ